MTVIMTHPVRSPFSPKYLMRGVPFAADVSEEDGANATGVEHGFGAPNTLFAQFRKVKRQRNKWVCDLLAGTATLDNRDYAFARCDATFVLTFGK